MLGGPKQLRRRRNSCKWGAVGRDSLSENILHAIVFEMTSCSECVAWSMAEATARHKPDATSQRRTHQASAQPRMHRTSAKRTKPAPNAPNYRQTHRTSAKRTEPAPNAPRRRQTHRAKKGLRGMRAGLISDLGLTSYLQVDYKLLTSWL